MQSGRKIFACAAVLLVLAALPALPAPQTKAPRDPEVIDAQGFTRLLEKYRGKPLIVNFWATWCEPCREEYPLLNELAAKYAPKGLNVVGITLDDEGEMLLVRRFIARYKPVFPNYRKAPGKNDEFVRAVLPKWNGSIPASFFYAADGRQIGHLVGAGDREAFEAAIRMLLSYKPENAGAAPEKPNGKDRP